MALVSCSKRRPPCGWAGWLRSGARRVINLLHTLHEALEISGCWRNKLVLKTCHSAAAALCSRHATFKKRENMVLSKWASKAAGSVERKRWGHCTARHQRVETPALEIYQQPRAWVCKFECFCREFAPEFRLVMWNPPGPSWLENWCF